MPVSSSIINASNIYKIAISKCFQPCMETKSTHYCDNILLTKIFTSEHRDFAVCHLLCSKTAVGSRWSQDGSRAAAVQSECGNQQSPGPPAVLRY